MKKTLKIAALAALASVGLAANSQAALLTYTGDVAESNQPGSVSYFNFSTTDSGIVRVETFTDNFDSYLWLFRDDGDLTRDDAIAADDDSGTRSLSPLGFFNSRIDTLLGAGSYITAVGDFRLTRGEAVAGINNSRALGVGSGSYRLEVEGDYAVDQNTSSVSEPLTLSLFGLALAGFGALRRRKA